jgi:hypothetical protein
LFSSKEKIISLYNAVCDENYPLDAKLEVNTLKNVLFMGQINDLSFTIENRCIVLIEHQSTINENMPLRMLMYVSKLFERIVNNGQYRRNLCKLPRPEFTVLYNGTEKFPERETYRLSDAFIDTEKGEVNLELIVNVVNINYDQNSEVLKKSKDLKDYSHFMDLIRKYRKEENMELGVAIVEAIKDAKELNILQDFLEEHEKEVAKMLYEEFDLDACLETEREEAKAKGHEEGLAEGMEKGKAEGIAEGMEKGKAEGLAEGEKSAFLRFVEGMKAAGFSSENIQAAINSSGMAALAH